MKADRASLLAVMAGRTVELNVAGKRCRVVTTADEEELRRLAAMVEDKLAEVLRPGRPVTTEAMLLAAMALAHDVDEQRSRANVVCRKAKRGLQRLLQRVDAALDGSGVGSSAAEQSHRRLSSGGQAAARPHHAAVAGALNRSRHPAAGAEPRSKALLSGSAPANAVKQGSGRSPDNGS